MAPPNGKKNWSALSEDEKDRCPRKNKLAFFDNEKLELLKNITRRDEHEKAEKDGKPPTERTRILCHNRIASARGNLDDIARRLKPAPDFDYSNDNACREEMLQMINKSIHKHQVARESTKSLAKSPADQVKCVNPNRRRVHRKLMQPETRVVGRSAKFFSNQIEDENVGDFKTDSDVEIADSSGDSEYADTDSSRTILLGKNAVKTRASTRSISKREIDKVAEFEKQHALALIKAQNKASRKQTNPDVIDLDSEDEPELGPEPEYEYHLRPLPKPEIPSGYPIYDSGDVVIMLYSKEWRFQYQLHEAHLRGKSLRLDAELNKTMQEACQELKSQSTHAIKRLGLTFHQGEWYIGRTSFTRKLPKGRSPKPTEPSIPEPPFDVLESFDNLFMIFYDMPPDIDTKNISVGFDQTGWLIELSRAYWCEALALKAIRQVWEALGNHLVRHILHDPPRWLRFGWIIQSTMIVREALIHVVAIYPDWRWPTDVDILTPEINNFVEEKANELCVKQMTVTMKLTKISTESTGQDENGNLLIEFRHPEFYKVFVTAVWQDWFRQQRIQSNNANAGNIFRAMENPDAYLSEGDLRVKLSVGQDLDPDDFELLVSHLKILKRLAQEHTLALTQNFSKIHIQDFKDLGIGWLTCTNVEEHELPWGS